MGGKGADKAAALLLTLDRRTAALLLKELPERERLLVTRALAGMPDVFLDRQTQVDLLKRFRAGLNALQGDAPGTQAITGLLTDALGEDARRIADDLAMRERLDGARAVLDRTDGRSLAFVLKDEHPQAVAIILLELGARTAAAALPHFDKDMQADLVQRMVTMEGPPPEFVGALLEAAAGRVRLLTAAEASGDRTERLKAVAGILNQFDDRVQQDLLSPLEAEHPDQAQRVREQLFTFDDLLKLGPREVQRVLAGIDTSVLALALKGATPEMEAFLTSNVSKRTIERVKEERETMGAVRLSEVRQAQQEMATVARELIQRGEIQFASAGEDQLVQ